MQLILIISLLALIGFFLYAGMASAATIIFILLLVDIAGGYITAFLGFIWRIITGIADTGKGEFDELEKTKTNYPQGKKFLEDGLSRTGKAIGKGEAAKASGKKIVEKRPDGEVVHDSISDFLNGIGKLFKK